MSDQSDVKFRISGQITTKIQRKLEDNLLLCGFNLHFIRKLNQIIDGDSTPKKLFYDLLTTFPSPVKHIGLLKVIRSLSIYATSLIILEI